MVLLALLRDEDFLDIPVNGGSFTLSTVVQGEYSRESIQAFTVLSLDDLWKKQRLFHVGDTIIISKEAPLREESFVVFFEQGNWWMDIYDAQREVPSYCVIRFSISQENRSMPEEEDGGKSDDAYDEETLPQLDEGVRVTPMSFDEFFSRLADKSREEDTEEENGSEEDDYDDETRARLERGVRVRPIDLSDIFLRKSPNGENQQE